MIKKFIFLLLLISTGISYYLWKNDELTPEGVKNFAQNVKDSDADDWKSFMKKTGEVIGETGEKVIDLGVSLKKDLDEVDWKDLKEKVGLSSDDLEKYKKSLDFVYEEPAVAEENSVSEVSEVVEEVKEVAPVAVVPKAEVVEAPKNIPPKKENVTSTPAPPRLKYWDKGMELLGEAKKENVKGIPGKPNHISHLRKAVSLYQKSLKEFETSRKREKLSPAKKRELEKIEQNIQQQIYWGKKLDRV